jgi:hypothetical protein
VVSEKARHELFTCGNQSASIWNALALQFLNSAQQFVDVPPLHIKAVL